MDTIIKPCKLNGTINAISSKSYAHRIIFASMMADESTEIEINGISLDIMATLNAVKTLGGDFEICGNKCTVHPIKVLNKNCMINCRESGTTARILIAICSALGGGATVIGEGRLPDRPFSELVNALCDNGVTVDSEKLPMKISGKLRSGIYKIAGNVSSQYITGLMFALSLLEDKSEIVLTTPLVSSAYIDITIDVLNKFGINILKSENGYTVLSGKLKSPKRIKCDGDWSNSAFWIVANKIGKGVDVMGLDADSTQGDKKIIDILDDTRIDVSEIPDLFPILAVLAMSRKGKTLLYNAERLKIKESDRIKSTYNMIKSLGGKATFGDDFLEITGEGRIKGGTVDSFNDHRIVMSAAVASLISEGDIIIKNSEAVNKSYPSFFDEFKRMGGIVDVI